LSKSDKFYHKASTNNLSKRLASAIKEISQCSMLSDDPGHYRVVSAHALIIKVEKRLIKVYG
jgi:hypothetical protein